MLKAVVFDFDGVIIDSEPLHYEAFVSVARGFGVDFTYLEYVQKYIGYDDRDGFRAMLAEAVDEIADDDRIAALGRQKRERFAQAVVRGVAVFPGARSLIEHIGAALPIAIASGATRNDIDLILDAVQLKDRFECVISADDVACSKPDPESYVLAVNGLTRLHPELAIAPRDCLSLEDTDAGIQSAREAGLWTLGVAHGTESQSLCRADRVVPSLEGLTLEILQTWHAGSLP